MNAVFLTVIAMVFGTPIEVLDVFPTMEECLTVAEAVVEMNEAVTTDCAWFTLDSKTWRTVFGEKI